MSMTQTEWAARVAAIGKMAGWGDSAAQEILRQPEPHSGILAKMSQNDSPAVIAAIRKLCAAWLAAEGAVANRWRTGTPGRPGQYWCQRHDHVFGMLRWAGGEWWAVTGGDLEPMELAPLRWQELDGMNYEVPRG